MQGQTGLFGLAFFFAAITLGAGGAGRCNPLLRNALFRRERASPKRLTADVTFTRAFPHVQVMNDFSTIQGGHTHAELSIGRQPKFAYFLAAAVAVVLVLAGAETIKTVDAYVARTETVKPSDPSPTPIPAADDLAPAICE